MVIFETDRLRFRHLVMEDLDALFRLYSDPEIRKYYPDGVRTLEETREELQWFLHGHPGHPELGLWATELTKTGEFIGRSGLLPWNISGVSEVEIAYMVDKRFWRQGYGSEIANGLVKYAFETLKLARVIALMDSDHDASLKTATSAGLAFEKTIEMHGVESVLYSTRNQMRTSS